MGRKIASIIHRHTASARRKVDGLKDDLRLRLRSLPSLVGTSLLTCLALSVLVFAFDRLVHNGVDIAHHPTRWYFAICAVALMAILWTAYHLRLRRLRAQFNLTFEARVSERTRIARDLHDTLLQSFHGLILRLETVSQLLPESEARLKLDSTIQQASQAIAEGRDAVAGLRASIVECDLAHAISRLGEELATTSNNERSAAFVLIIEGRSRDLHPIVREDIYKISAEALRNAFRHAQAERVEVEIRYDNEQFRLRVRDDGNGIDPVVLSSKNGHYGLRGMRERATLIGGKLVIWSEMGTGTEVELRVPSSVAFTAVGKHRRRSEVCLNNERTT